MNKYTISRVTFGLADYLNNAGTVAIAYDTRNHSREFAFCIADILSSCGIEVYIYDRPAPTPMLSFTVRFLKADAGIVVTASHNPKEYNGYKVYNKHGCQITDEVAKEITSCIEKHGCFEKYSANANKIHLLEEEMEDSFLDAVLRCGVGVKREYPSFVYTPLNGAGRIPAEKLFKRLGISNYALVPEQSNANGDFPTCPYPNPEEPAALELALKLAKERNAELVIATDPDADRIGVAVLDGKGYRILTGNEVGVLLEHFILEYRKESCTLPCLGYVIKTIVSTDLADAVAATYGVKTIDVLTGFKYIGEKIDELPSEDSFIFGMEESCGYLTGAHVRDKDSISAMLCILQMAAYYKSNGLSLVDELTLIYKQYGFYDSRLISRFFSGKSGKRRMDELIENIRRMPFGELASEKVLSFRDYAYGLDGLPKSNVLLFSSQNCKVIIRPSGTEPKLKLYFFAKGEDAESVALKMEKLVTDICKKLE